MYHNLIFPYYKVSNLLFSKIDSILIIVIIETENILVFIKVHILLHVYISFEFTTFSIVIVDEIHNIFNCSFIIKQKETGIIYINNSIGSTNVDTSSTLGT